MTYNPRIKNSENGTIKISGSVAVNKTGTNISCSNLTTTDSLSFSSATSNQAQVSLFSVPGGVKTPVRKISDSTNINSDDHVILVDATDKYVTLDLPSSSQVPGQQFVIKKTDASYNVVKIKGEPPYALFDQTSVLAASNNATSDLDFGMSVAVNSTGTRLFIGAPGNLRTYADEGCVYIYSRENSTSQWQQTQTVYGSLLNQAYEYFGFSVATNAAGDCFVVGAYGDETVGGADKMGLAYVFTSGSSGWVQTKILTGSFATGSAEWFGYSVAMNEGGNLIVVGAPNDYKASGGVTYKGMAYVFSSGSSGWTENQSLSGSLAVNTFEFFGHSVAINSSGDRIVIGAYGDETVGGSDAMGLTYVFTSGSSGWKETAVLNGSAATMPDDNFGYSVAINSLGDRIVVGAKSNSEAYVFVSGSTGWKERKRLTGSLAVTSDYFGWSVSMNGIGDRIVVGAYNDEASGGNSGMGLAYVFTSGSSGWAQSKILSGSLANAASDFFGRSVVMNSDGDCIAVGAVNDEGQGRAYVFEASGTMDGSANKILYKKNESVKLVSDGSGSWNII